MFKYQHPVASVQWKKTKLSIKSIAFPTVTHTHTHRKKFPIMAQAQSFRQIVGVPSSPVSINDSTLIIIDAQNEYAAGKLATVNIAQTRKTIASVLGKYRASAHGGRNVVHVLHEVPAGAPVFTPNTPLAEELEELKPQAGEKVVKKNFPSAFARTDLDAYLKGLGEVGKKIVLVGYMAHVCVSTTARAGAELGYDVVVVEDAVGDRDIPGVKGEELTRVALRELEDFFATVVKAEEI